VRAREDYAKEGAVEYLNVIANRDSLDEMLKLTNYRREVPVIVKDGKVTVGHGGT